MVGKLTKNQKRRLKKKEEKRLRKLEDDSGNSNVQHEIKKEMDKIIEEKKKELSMEKKKIDNEENKENNEDEAKTDDEEGEIEIVEESMFEKYKNQYAELQEVFEKFETNQKMKDELAKEKEKENDRGSVKQQDAAESLMNLDKDENKDEDPNAPRLNKKQRKLAGRLTIAELKQLVKRPDVVESVDITSADPRLLVYLKGYRNTVPVPVHWCQKKRYLQGKRGSEKKPFKLPDYIEATGIMQERARIAQEDAARGLRSQARDRMHPKINRLHIDYEVLHAAFFVHNTKPPLTSFGDMYYEGKEYKSSPIERKPGKLSPELKEALGMGPNSPPPWLFLMQRYGPPPSYPHLKIPGLNSPLPPGASYGTMPGQWGIPPVDEHGRPLFGDPYGTYVEEEDENEEHQDPAKKALWGTIADVYEEPEQFENDEEEEEENEEEENEEEKEERKEVGMGSIPGISTPFDISLRKEGIIEEEDKPLYVVLEEKKVEYEGGLLRSGTQYIIPKANDSENSNSIGSSSLIEKSEKEKRKSPSLPEKFKL